MNRPYKVAVSLAGLAIGAAIALWVFRERVLTGNRALLKAHSDMAAVATAASLYSVDCGTPPRDIEDLVTNPSGIPNWRGPYLHDADRRFDPWGRKYRLVPCRASNELVRVESDGRDGTGSGDDLFYIEPR